METGMTTGMTTGPAFVAGLGAFADRYEGFILDQWGVLHDGAAPLPGVLDALAELVRRNKRVVLLSNSGRRAGLSVRRLREMGFNPGDFAAVVTSGEATWRLMAARAEPPFDRLGRRCYLLTHMGDRQIVEGLGITTVDDVGQADFILASGLEGQTDAELDGLARAGVARGLPTICSNPDLVAVSMDTMVRAPGTFAALYASLGGTVTYVGKPYRPIYTACLDALDDLRPGEIVAVGDSMAHDILGAKAAGLDAAFVTGGIHRDEFPPGASRAGNVAALGRLADAHGAVPDWVLPGLRW